MSKNGSLKNTESIVLCALFVALFTVSAYLKIYIAGVPHTFQFFFVVMAGMLLGSKLGAAAVSAYLLMGLIGLPVFTGGSGFSYVFQPTFGYLVGFVIAAFVAGRIVEKTAHPGYKRLFAASAAAFFIVYFLGMVYFYLIRNFYMADAPIGVWSVFVSCFVMIAPQDAILLVCASVLGHRIIPVLQRNRQKRGRNRE